MKYKIVNLLAWFMLVWGYSAKVSDLISNVGIERNSIAWYIVLFFAASVPIIAIYYFI